MPNSDEHTAETVNWTAAWLHGALARLRVHVSGARDEVKRSSSVECPSKPMHSPSTPRWERRDNNIAAVPCTQCCFCRQLAKVQKRHVAQNCVRAIFRMCWSGSRREARSTGVDISIIMASSSASSDRERARANRVTYITFAVAFTGWRGGSGERAL
jgi:hypothetical protein